MSLWGFDGGDNSLTTWSSLTQFDDMVWNEFGETHGDHVVPNPNSPQISWLPNGDRRKRINRELSLSGCSIKGESPTSIGVADSVSEMSSGNQDESNGALLLQDTTILASTFVEGGWTDLEGVSVDHPVESEPFSSDPSPVRQELEDDTGDERIKDQQGMKEEVQPYTCEEDASMVTDPFSISDVGSQDGGLEMFGNGNVSSKADSLLELGWENIGNLDDMDKLFRNNDTSFEPVMINGTDGLEWASSSTPLVGALDSGMQFEKPSPVSELTAVKVEVDAVENKTGVAFGECVSTGKLDNVPADRGSPRSQNISAGAPVQKRSLPCTDRRDNRSCEAKSPHALLSGKESTKEAIDLSSGSFPEVEKVTLAQAYRAHRHAANRKRSEDRFKQTTSYRKLSPGPSYNATHADVRQLQTLPLRLPGKLPHSQSTSAFPLQYFPPTITQLVGASHQLQMPEGVPYIQVGYPVHHLPAMASCPFTPIMHMQHPQAMFVDLQHQGSQGQRSPLLLPQPSPLSSYRPFDDSDSPLTSSPCMTPQEKLEKLRWRQQMQARMAVEQQQQLLSSQNGEGIEITTYRKQQQAIHHGLLANQPGMALVPTSECLVTSTLETDERLVVPEGDVPSSNSSEEEEDCSLEGSVLCQLKSTVSALDISTRLCIRDALYRLARSAMKRRGAGCDTLNGSQGSEEHDSGTNAVESSSASGPPSARHSRATSMSVVETETNPIDRSIAKLLFSRPQPPMFGRPYVHTRDSSLSGQGSALDKALKK